MFPTCLVCPTVFFTLNVFLWFLIYATALPSIPSPHLTGVALDLQVHLQLNYLNFS